jgi:hypothetical protein
MKEDKYYTKFFSGNSSKSISAQQNKIKTDKNLNFQKSLTTK